MTPRMAAYIESIMTGLMSMTRMTAAKTAAVASQGFGRNLRGAMFDKIQDFSFADIDRFSSASLITRLTNDVNSIQMTVMMCLRMLVRAPVQLLSALVVCLTMNARLTLVIAVVIPVMCLLLWLIMRACERLFTRFQQKIDALNDTVQEKLSLVARFGVTIYFGKPAKKEFQEIVRQLAKRNGIEMDEERLLLEANRWELSHGGMSGRTAQQFIDYLLGME